MAEINYNPPAWLVTHFDKVKLDVERARKFEQMRMRLCAELGKDNKVCEVNNLWMKALDLLLAYESALLTKVEYFDAEGKKVET